MSSKKPKFSFVTLFLLIVIEPIFFKYQPKIGICVSSFFKINRGELKTKINITVHKFSATAKAAIEALGGVCTEI